MLVGVSAFMCVCVCVHGGTRWEQERAFGWRRSNNVRPSARSLPPRLTSGRKSAEREARSEKVPGAAGR